MNRNHRSASWSNGWVLALTSALALVELVLASRYNYLLFHSLAELFSILVAGAMFVLAWNTWVFTDNDYLQFLGIAFLCVAGFDFVHTLAYKGMNIFIGYDADLPTQLWIAARYVQSISLLIAPTFLNRKVDRHVLFIAYMILFIALLVTIFGGVFPDCYVEGVGLTPFKVASEYVIALILGLSTLRLFRRREALNRDVFRWMVAAIALTILSELAFTFYVGVYDLSNLVGHVFKIVALYFIYRAIIETGLRKPYALLFQDMQQSLAAQRESETKFRSYIENAPYGVFVADQDGRYVEVNEAACRITGYTRDELLSTSILQIIPPEHTEEAAIHFQQVVEEGSATGEVSFVKADGSRRWWSVLAVRLSDTRFLAYTEDITERRRAEEALRESEERYRQMFADHSAVMLLIDPNDGKIVDANPAAAAFYGQSIDALKKLRIQQINGLPVSEVIARMDEARQREQNYFVFEHQLASGEMRDVEVHSVPIEVEGRTLLYSIIHDITQRKQAEEALRESREQYRLLVDNSTDYIAKIDRSGRVVFASETARRFHGYRPEELVGTTSFDRVHPHDRDRVMADVQRMMEDGKDARVEFRLKRKDGNYMWIETTGRMVHNSETGSPEAVLVTRDITKRKRAQDALKAERDRAQRYLDIAGTMILALDREGKITLINRKGCEILGYERQEIIDQNWFDIFLPEYTRNETRNAFDTLLSGDEESFRTAERHVLTRTGEERVILWHNVPLRSDSGSIIGTLSSGSDITELRETEKILQQHIQRLEALHDIDQAILEAKSLEETAQIAVCHLQPMLACPSCSVLMYNSATKLFHVLATEVEEGTAISPGAFLPSHPEMVASLKKGKMIQLDSIQSAPTSGEGRRLAASKDVDVTLLVPLLAQQELIGLVATAAEHPDAFTPDHRDILRQVSASLAVALQQARLLEQTREDAWAKAMLLQEVNHRVLNNLTAIIGILDMEQRRPLDDETDLRAVLDDVTHRIGGMTTVHRMLSSAQWQPLDVKNVVEKVIYAALSGSPIRHQIELTVDAPEESLRLPSKQAISMALVINELTTNSVKYAFRDRFQGQIHVRITPLDEERIQVIFRDDGPGIPDDVLAGKQRNVGFWLVETNVRHTLDGEIDYHNDDGAVVTFTLDRVPLS